VVSDPSHRRLPSFLATWTLLPPHVSNPPGSLEQKLMGAANILIEC
jgi:hypothetical protein